MENFVAPAVLEWIHVKPASITPMFVLGLLLWMIYKSITFIWQRLEMRRIIKRSGIPQAKGGNLISGFSRDNWIHGNFCEYLLNSHKTLGKYVAVFYGPDTFVFTTDFDLIQKVFVTDGSKHVNQYDQRMELSPPTAGGIFQMKGDQWHRARRSVNPLLTKKQVSSQQEVEERSESCRKLLTLIAGVPIDPAGGHRVDVLYNFTAFMMDVSFKKVLDRHDYIELEPGRKNKLVETGEKAFKNFYNTIVYLCFFVSLSPVRYLHKFTEMGSYFQLLSDTMGDSIRMKKQGLVNRQETVTNCTPVSKIIDTFVAPNSEMRDQDAVNQLSFFLLASAETASRSLTLLFWHLARHPEIQERLREAIMGEGEEAAYLEWCIKETIRLYPPVPLFGRALSENVSSATGVTLLKGTTLTICPYAIHRIEEYWGPDANEFRPERFAEPLKHRLQFIGFGAGIRGCPGQHLAFKILKEATVQLLTHYRVEPTNTTPQTINWSPKNFVTLLVEGPIELNFVEIQPAHIQQT